MGRLRSGCAGVALLLNVAPSGAAPLEHAGRFEAERDRLEAETRAVKGQIRMERARIERLKRRIEQFRRQNRVADRQLLEMLRRQDGGKKAGPDMASDGR